MTASLTPSTLPLLKFEQDKNLIATCQYIVSELKNGIPGYESKQSCLEVVINALGNLAKVDRRGPNQLKAYRLTEQLNDIRKKLQKWAGPKHPW